MAMPLRPNGSVASYARRSCAMGCGSRPTAGTAQDRPNDMDAGQTAAADAVTGEAVVVSPRQDLGPGSSASPREFRERSAARLAHR